ncbi:MAG: hypothetical protein CFH05_01255 [Alphaproteobacteria bacterium MarineAlpha3_Bin4]|nr:MAG: hypothetical protein CFH05_01255 [Alphaproteobacteria bacterium MarineAlpha3_Bin4]
MTDGLSVSKQAIFELARQPSVYQSETVREIRARVAVAEGRQSENERKSLRRLNQILSLDQPMPNNVPRGYYLNIEV